MTPKLPMKRSSMEVKSRY